MVWQLFNWPAGQPADALILPDLPDGFQNKILATQRIEIEQLNHRWTQMTWLKTA
jgi:hypothetical protein